MSNGERKMKKVNKQGFTLVEIMIVVAIIGLLAAIGIPSFSKARNTSREKSCVNNLRIIDGAKEQHAMDANLSAGDAAPAAASLDPYVKGGTDKVICPADSAKTFATSYTIDAIGTPPSCLKDDGGIHAPNEIFGTTAETLVP